VLVIATGGGHGCEMLSAPIHPYTHPPPALFHSPALPFLHLTDRSSLALRTGCGCSCAERGSGSGVYGWRPRVLVIAAGGGHGCEMLSATIPSSHHSPAARHPPLTCAALPALARSPIPGVADWALVLMRRAWVGKWCVRVAASGCW
jgi:hypothetical protein